MRISVKKLTHHPLNKKIYSISSIDDLTESIAKVGLLENLVINQNNQIISGNRRFSAIKKLGWKTVSCDRIEIAKKDTPQILIHYNKQRIKTCRELLNEIKILVPQYQIGQGKRTDLTSVTENRSGRTRDKVGESLGISGSQIAKLLYIEKINPSLIDLIDVGELTVSQGYFQCRKLNEKPKRKLNRPSSNDFVDFPYSIVNGDCQEVMSRMEENSIQTCVTDPPYGMNFAEWDKKVPSIDIWKEIYRVLMPGAFCLSFCSPQLYHRLGVEIENSGFDIKDQIMWMTTTKMPKFNRLKPAHEPIVVAQKPPQGSIDQNHRIWGCGVIDIETARIPWDKEPPKKWVRGGIHRRVFGGKGNTKGGEKEYGVGGSNPNGRYPSNVIGEVLPQHQKYF